MKSLDISTHSSPWVNWCMAWLLLCCSSILLVPENIRHTALNYWVEQNIAYLVLGVLISSSYFAARFLLFLWDQLLTQIAARYSQRQLQRMINHLDFAEKAILREFVLQRRSVIKLPLSEPSVKNLLDNGILDYAYGQPNDNDNAQIKPMMISLHARPLLTYKVLGMSRSSMSDEQIEQLMSARPKFAKN